MSVERNGYELRASSCALRAARFELRAEEPPFPILSSPRAARRAQLAARAGFTLLELLLVLVIVGLGAAIAAARLTGTREKIGVEMAAQTLVDQARRSQHLAVLSGQVVRMRLNLSDRELAIAVLDGVKESVPQDGESAHVALTHSADELTIAFTRSDAVQADASTTIDWIFTPDQRCDPAGIVTFTAASRSAAVRLSAGARLPARINDDVTAARNTMATP